MHFYYNRPKNRYLIFFQLLAAHKIIMFHSLIIAAVAENASVVI